MNTSLPSGKCRAQVGSHLTDGINVPKWKF